MTQQMIELYKEACEFAYNVCKNEGRTGGPSDHIWHTLSTGRFAELIVRECMDLSMLPESECGNWSHLSPAEVIAKHFGVTQ